MPPIEFAKLTVSGMPNDAGESYWMFEGPNVPAREIVSPDSMTMISNLGRDSWLAQVTDTHDGRWTRFLLSRQAG